MRTVAILVLGVSLTVIAHAQQPKPPVGLTSSDVPQYQVKCPVGASDAARCVVDAGTYRGWSIYSTHCAACHGAGAVGANDAPALVDRLRKRVDYDGVQFVVMNGHEGESGTMPSWKEDPHVVVNIDRLYQYLKALADNALPVGTPNKAKK